MFELLRKGKPKTLNEWRLEAKLTVQELAKLAHVDRRTATKVKTNEPLQDVKIAALLEAIGKKIGKKLSFEDVYNLNISKVERKGKTDENLPSSIVESTDS